MHANTPTPRHALHRQLKLAHMLTAQHQPHHTARIRIRPVHRIRQIALQAPRVPRELRGRDRATADAGAVCQVERDGAEVDGHAREGAGRHAAAARAGWQVDRGQAGGGAEDDLALVGDGSAVAGDCGVG